MTYNGKDLVEMLPETWDGKSRRMLVWDDTSKNPLDGIVVGYCPDDNCWMVIGQYSDGCRWKHCAEIPEEELRIGIKPRYDFMFNMLNTKETPKEEPKQEHSIDEMFKILTAYKEGKQIYRCRKFSSINRCCKFSSDIEIEKIPLYNENEPHDFDFHSYAYSLNEITWKDFSQAEAFKYRLWNVYGTTRNNEGNKYLTYEDALKLFNDGVEYGKYQSHA